EPANNAQELTATLSSKLTGLSTADTFLFNLNSSKDVLIGLNGPQHEFALDHAAFLGATAPQVVNQMYDAVGHSIPTDAHSATTGSTTPAPQPQNHLDIFHLS